MEQKQSIDHSIEQVKDSVSKVLEMAKKLGANSAEVSISKMQGLSVSTRMGEVDTVEFNNDGALGISLYKDGRKGSASTADLSDSALQQSVQAAINIADYTSVDPCAGLADKQSLAFEPEDLDLYHPQPITPDQAIELARETEVAALERDQRIINSDGANFASYEGFKVYGNSHSQLVAYPSTRHSLTCMMIAGDADDMQRDYNYSVSREFANLQEPKILGEQAADAALARLNGRKLATQKCPVMFRADVANSLFGHFISAISGGNLYRDSSFLIDSIGEQVFNEHLQIREMPFIKRGLASSAFDSEGVATIERDIIKDGHLQSYLLTSYSARKLGLQTTGNAGGIHNWQVSANGGDFDAMLKQLGTGLLVTELMGQGVNVVTGDYSRGAAGFWVENGEIAYPVSEITIAGNLKDIFKSLVLSGNDFDLRGSIKTGSLLIEQMQISGQ
ncbi:metalloprotease PmbA [Thalassotalea sp. HSM 43]|uniref:metalloprotease PmbA n=1 Tax=Thalassotalea sp. HSM 43 TaxID=2552945 RepID=UPI001081EA54|nr:metalloprotease PmbA [Thalassotalea sp. HSM 43]QBY04772.1 metalloprotease PmbA [Thalassotalea sp. HSM 43]